MQRNWIGRSEGTLVDFKLDRRRGRAGERSPSSPPASTPSTERPPCSSRPSTLWSPISSRRTPAYAPRSTKCSPNRRKAKETGDVGAIEKHGIDTGRFALNPFNGERVPIWVANYVLMDYGTGAIMSVPAHDERDYEFAKKYGSTSAWSSCRAAKATPPIGDPETRSCPSSNQTAC